MDPCWPSRESIRAIRTHHCSDKEYTNCCNTVGSQRLATASTGINLDACIPSKLAYRVKVPRNFVGSQIRGTMLVLAMTILCLVAITVLHLISLASDQLLSPRISPELAFAISYYAVVGVVVFCLLMCAFYWLPNRAQQLRIIIPEALFATALLLIADQVFRWLVPDMRLEEVYGPFFVSVTILLWGYTFGNIIAGSARLGANGFFFRSARIENSPKDRAVPHWRHPDLGRRRQ
jgi:membrane protein